MTSVYTLPHKFIHYAPGASGVFVTKLLACLQADLIVDIQLAETGSAHSPGPDIRMLGLMFLEQLTQPNDADFLDLVANSVITEHNKQVNNPAHCYPMIGFSHSFNMATVLQEIFPNSSTLLITCRTQLERMVAEVNHIIKWTLQPHKSETELSFIEEWRTTLLDTIRKRSCITTLADFVSTDILGPGYHLKVIDPKYYNIILFFCVEGLFEDCRLPVSDYPTSSFIEIPYRVIMAGNESLFTKKLELLYGEKLTERQINFVDKNFKNYFSKQNPELISDPYRFYRNLKIRAGQQIKELTGETNWLKR